MSDYQFKFKSPQEYYDALVKTSRNGGFPAFDFFTKSCQYRTINGKACAIGIGIPDEIYSSKLEGSVAYLEKQVSNLLPSWATIQQLSQLQSIHDNLAKLPEWNHKVFLGFLSSLDLFKDCRFKWDEMI